MVWIRITIHDKKEMPYDRNTISLNTPSDRIIELKFLENQIIIDDVEVEYPCSKQKGGRANTYHQPKAMKS